MIKTRTEIREWCKENNWVFNPELSYVDEGDWGEDEDATVRVYSLKDLEKYRKEKQRWNKEAKKEKNVWGSCWYDGYIPNSKLNLYEGCDPFCCGLYSFGGFEDFLDVTSILLEHALMYYLRKSKHPLFQCSTLTQKTWANINKALRATGFKERARLKSNHKNVQYQIIAWDRLPVGKDKL